MNISDLKDYKIVSAPMPQGEVTNISQLNGNYTTQDRAQPQKPSLPLLTNPNGGFGTALKDVAVGAGKSLVSGGRDLAGMVQGLGQDVLRTTTGSAPQGIQSISNDNPVGQQVSQQLQAKSRGEQVGKVLETGAELGAGFASKGGQQAVTMAQEGVNAYKAGQEAKLATKEGSKITEMISPKPTVKEAKLATTQGRFVEGKKPTMFRAGTEDTIAPSQKTMSASQTIQKNIPNASKMSPSELYTAVDKNIGDTATKLRPQMQATPIKPATIEKINTDWEALKKSQIADAPATEEVNVAKRQAKFESLLKKSGSSSHADLWDTAIKYDDSIPENVKRATSLSPESYQLQKQEWLDNRQILSDAMDKSSRPEFKAMSDMYNAKTGLLSKAKVDKAQISKVNQFLKDNPKTAKVLGGVTIYEVAKKLGLPLP